MWVTVIFTSLLLAASVQTYSTDEFVQFILDTLKKNQTIDYALKHYKGKPCAAPVSMMPSFDDWGHRISDKKCLEYIWDAKEGGETDTVKMCRLSLISQILKGLSKPVPYVLYGEEASRGEFPHMGAIGWRARDKTKQWIFKCGGTLISKNFLLTAAHCSKLSLKHAVDVVQTAPEIVRLGVVNIAEDEFNVNGDGLDIKIESITVYPEYESPIRYYDIALIELENDVKFKSNVHPACLWSRPMYNELDGRGIVTGWGVTEKGNPEDVLQTGIVDFITDEECDHLLQDYHSRKWSGLCSNQMCAGILEGGVDTCQGDSGGPLQVNIPLTKGKMYWALGVTSFSFACGGKDLPSIYSRVSSFIDWIEETVWDSVSSKGKEHVICKINDK